MRATGHDAFDSSLAGLDWPPGPEFLDQLRACPSSQIRDLVERLGISDSGDTWLEILAMHAEFRIDNGETPTPEEYAAGFPEHTTEVRDRIASLLSSNRNLKSTVLVEDGRSIEAEPPAPLPTQIDRYQLLRPLGRGGFGEVWAARDPMLDREVAIKLLHVEADAVPEEMDLLLQEGRRLARLDHEHIVRILDAGKVDGRVYLVSELMSGGTLAKRLSRSPASIPQTVEWIATLARALQHAHEQGFVHRDIKPSNILFDAAGHPHLADFGVALSEQELAVESPGTVGTISYMSPEQASGNSHQVDPRSDIYSLGLVLYRLLAGRLPFSDASSAKYLEMVRTRAVRPLRAIREEIPPELEAICLACLETDPRRRMRSAVELAERLDRLRETEGSNRGVAAPPKPPRRRWPYAAAACAAALALAFVLLRPDPKSPALDPEQARLAALPRNVVSFEPYDSHDRIQYDATTRKLVVDAFGVAAFRAGDNSSPDFRAEVTFETSRDLGAGGLFWNLRILPDGAENALAVFAGRMAADAPVEIWVDELTIDDSPGGRRSVGHSSTLFRMTAEAKSIRRAVLQVQANAQEVTQVWLNGAPQLSEPVPLPAQDPASTSRTGWGVCGYLGEISISSFSEK